MLCGRPEVKLENPSPQQLSAAPPVSLPSASTHTSAGTDRLVTRPQCNVPRPPSPQPTAPTFPAEIEPGRRRRSNYPSLAATDSHVKQFASNVLMFHRGGLSSPGFCAFLTLYGRRYWHRLQFHISPTGLSQIFPVPSQSVERRGERRQVTFLPFFSCRGRAWKPSAHPTSFLRERAAALIGSGQVLVVTSVCSRLVAHQARASRCKHRCTEGGIRRESELSIRQPGWHTTCSRGSRNSQPSLTCSRDSNLFSICDNVQIFVHGNSLKGGQVPSNAHIPRRVVAMPNTSAVDDAHCDSKAWRR